MPVLCERVGDVAPRRGRQGARVARFGGCNCWAHTVAPARPPLSQRAARLPAVAESVVAEAEATAGVSGALGRARRPRHPREEEVEPGAAQEETAQLEADVGVAEEATGLKEAAKASKAGPVLEQSGQQHTTEPEAEAEAEAKTEAGAAGWPTVEQALDAEYEEATQTVRAAMRAQEEAIRRAADALKQELHAQLRGHQAARGA